MQLRDRVFVLIVMIACLVGFYSLDPLNSDSDLADPEPEFFLFDPELPDFSGYTNVKAKKTAFFSFMLPLIEQENQRIAELREQLVELSQHIDDLDAGQQEWLLDLVRYYRVIASDSAEKILDEQWLLEELLIRIDQVPPSLALAQAANESAWGTSRFAVQGNNLFGQWCFRKGCGLIPGSRPQGESYEVAKFSSPRQSVQKYIHNLNTNLAYKEFRILRDAQRQSQSALSGHTIATTLTKYSSRGDDYVHELQAMIRVNQLGQYDTI